MAPAEEYKNLYQEIGRNSQITQNVFVANVTVTAALIGFGLSAKAGSIFLAPFAILIPSLFFIASQLDSTTRIAAYILVFLEDGSLGSNWETRWLSLREGRLLPTRRKYTLSLSGLYGLLSAACLLLAFRYWEYDLRWYVATVLPIVVGVGAGVRAVAAAFALTHVKAYIAAWRRLKEQSGRQ